MVDAMFGLAARFNYTVVTFELDHRDQQHWLRSHSQAPCVLAKDGCSPLEQIWNSRPKGLLQNEGVCIGATSIAFVPHIGGCQNGPKTPSKGKGQHNGKKTEDFD
jgi:hypothetical protein